MHAVPNALGGLLFLLAVAVATGALAASDLRTSAEEDRVVARLRSEPVEVVKDTEAGGGVTGARRLTLRFEDREELDVKWKPVPPRSMDGWNNSPRKEIAAYEIQRWLLDPPDHVVPTSVVRCLPLESFEAAKPSFEGSTCVLGVIGVWVHDVHIPTQIYDPKLFARDPVYARHMADMNLVTYLIAHKDGRSGNFLLGNDPANRRVFSIDNGISFGAPVHNYFVRNWDKLRVPALRKETVERLRAVPPQAFEGLALVAELKLDADGVWRHAPKTTRRDPGEGAFVEDGQLQLGLTREEIGELMERREDLLEDVDEGERKIF